MSDCSTALACKHFNSILEVYDLCVSDDWTIFMSELMLYCCQRMCMHLIHAGLMPCLPMHRSINRSTAEPVGATMRTDLVPPSPTYCTRDATAMLAHLQEERGGVESLPRTHIMCSLDVLISFELVANDTGYRIFWVFVAVSFAQG